LFLLDITSFVGYIPTPLLGGDGLSGSNPIGSVGHSFTSGYQIHVSNQPHTGGQPEFGGQPQIGTQPQLGGKPQAGVHNPLYEHSEPTTQNLPWNLPLQGNPQLSGGQHP
jgi:hypothetical protein